MSETPPTPEREPVGDDAAAVEAEPLVTEPVEAPRTEADAAAVEAATQRLKQNTRSRVIPSVFTPTGTNTLKERADSGHHHHGSFVGTWFISQPIAIFKYLFVLMGRGLKQLPAMAGKGGGKSSGGGHGGGHGGGGH